MKSFVTHFFQTERGATTIEYGLVAALISVLCIAGMTFVGAQLTGIYNAVFTAVMPALG
jgi:pilus assembly protein Flp/PilA